MKIAIKRMNGKYVAHRDSNDRGFDRKTRGVKISNQNLSHRRSIGRMIMEQYQSVRTLIIEGRQLKWAIENINNELRWTEQDKETLIMKKHDINACEKKHYQKLISMMNVLIDTNNLVMDVRSRIEEIMVPDILLALYGKRELEYSRHDKFEHRMKTVDRYLKTIAYLMTILDNELILHNLLNIQVLMINTHIDERM